MKNNSSIREKTLEELKNDLERRGIPSVFKTLRDSLHEINSPDHLFDTFMKLEDMIDDDNNGLSHIKSSSVFGIFIRKVLIAYKNLMFDGLSRLYEQLMGYKKMKVSFPVSAERMEQYTHKKALDLEKQIGVLSCDETEAQISTLLSLNPGLHQAHFLRYMNYMQNKEYAKSIDCLHRYFDYYGTYVMKQNGYQGNYSNNPLQYAVFNLALLQYNFQHYSQAAQAILESIKMAQLANDHTCLVHALVLYSDICYHTGDTSHATKLINQCIQAQEAAHMRMLEVKKEIKNRPEAVMTEHEKEIIERAQAVPTVEAQALLKLAMYTLQHAGVSSAKSSNYLDFYSKHLSGHEDDDGGKKMRIGVMALDYIKKSCAISTSNNDADQLGLALTTRSKVWDLIGHSQLAKLYSRIFLRFYGRTSSVSTSALAIANLTTLEPNSNKQLENLREDVKKFQKNGYSGFHEKKLELELENALDRGYLLEAEKLLEELLSLAPTLKENPDQNISIRILSARLLSKTGQHALAKGKLMSILEIAQGREDLILKVHVLMALVEVYINANAADYGLLHLLQLLDIAGELKFDSLLIKIRMLTAKLQMRVKLYKAARVLLLSCMPHSLVNCSLSVRLDLILLSAECDLRDGSTSERRLRDQLGKLANVEKLAKEQDNIRQLRSTYHLLALIYNKLGEIKKRNTASKKLMQIGAIRR